MNSNSILSTWEELKRLGTCAALRALGAKFPQADVTEVIEALKGVNASTIRIQFRRGQKGDAPASRPTAKAAAPQAQPFDEDAVRRLMGSQSRRATGRHITTLRASTGHYTSINQFDNLYIARFYDGRGRDVSKHMTGSRELVAKARAQLLKVAGPGATIKGE